MLFTLTYIAVFEQTLTPSTDFLPHAEYAVQESGFSGRQFFVYPVWHILVRLFYSIASMPMEHAAAFVTAIINAFTFIIIRNVLLEISDIKDKQNKKHLIDLISFMLCFIAPIYISWFNKNQYLGQFSPTLWHNPTFFAVKPIAVLCVIYFLKILNIYKTSSTCRNKDFISLSILMCISAICKPSFIQFFIPGIAIYLLVDCIFVKFKAFKCYLKFAAACAAPLIIALLQFLFVKNLEQGSSIYSNLTITFFTAFLAWTPNVFISMLLICGFPFYYIIVDYKNTLKDRSIQISLVLWLIAFLEAGLINFEGNNYGDWTWGYSLSLVFLWLFTTKGFLNYTFNNDGKYKAIISNIGYLLFFANFIAGVIYYIRCYNSIFS